MASLPASYASRMLRQPSTRTTRLSPPHGARWEPSDLSEELRRVSCSESRLHRTRLHRTRGFTNPRFRTRPNMYLWTPKATQANRHDLEVPSSNDRHTSPLLLPPLSNPTPPQIQQTYVALPGFFTFFSFSLAGSRGGQKYTLRAFIYDQQVLATARY